VTGTALESATIAIAATLERIMFEVSFFDLHEPDFDDLAPKRAKAETGTENAAQPTHSLARR